jgi:mRNA interferase MazF
MSKPTKIYDLYEVVKVPFPFTDTKSVKVRPALILSSAKHFNSKIGLSVMAMITSIKVDKGLWPTDIVIENLRLAGLPAPSVIRFKLFTLDDRLILDRLGILSEREQINVQKTLKEILGF